MHVTKIMCTYIALNLFNRVIHILHEIDLNSNRLRSKDNKNRKKNKLVKHQI